MKNTCFLFVPVLFLTLNAAAIRKTTQGSGTWNDPSLWSPAGVPASTDDVVVRAGDSLNVSTDQKIKSITVQANSKLVWSSSKRLTISGTFTVDGFADLNGGLISISTAGIFGWIIEYWSLDGGFKSCGVLIIFESIIFLNSSNTKLTLS